MTLPPDAESAPQPGALPANLPADLPAPPGAARHHAEVHRRVFHDSPDFISYCHMDGRYIDVNPAFERFVGLPRGEIIGRTPLEIGLWPGGLSQRSDFIAALRVEGRLLGYRRQLARANGELREVEGWASIVRLGAEEVLVAMGRDITERHRDEAELQQYRQRLEQLVEQRTLELRETNRRLETANEAKRTFLASMSHELRTPLNAILGYAQLLQLGPGLSPRQLAGLSTIEQGGRHLLALITDILDLARVEAGKMVLCPEPLELRRFLSVVVDIMRVRAEEKSLLFRFEASPDLPARVEADEQRLRQVLLNLLGNAVKFTDRGEIGLRVGARWQGAEVIVTFEVSDSGVGIAADALPRLFTPFEQVGEARRQVQGTGLGLSISQALVRLMGGEIHVTSTLGQGSRFAFEIKLAAAGLPPPPALPHAPPLATGYEGARRRVLVVDDVAANREVLADMLQTLGFDWLDAEDGYRALELMQDGPPPDLVLMDIAMPGLDGIQTLRRLRRIPGLASVPVIAVSASMSPANESECLEAGAASCLLKPIVLSQLVAHIGAALGLRWLDPAAGSS